MLLQAFYTIRSERQLMERLEFDLLFRWFVGLSADEQAWDHSTFTKNRDRLLEGEIAARFLGAVLAQKRVKRLLSTRHFSADGTLIAAWASLKSFKEHGGGDDDPPGGGGSGRNADVDFKGAIERDASLDHRSGGDALSQGPGDGGETLLHWPCADGEPLGIVRRRAADAGLRPCRAACRPGNDRGARRSGSWPVGVTLGADKGYDEAGFVAGLREVGVTPHVAQKARYSAIDGRTTRHESYRISQRIRKRIEEGFGWLKTIGGLHKSRFVGRDKTDWAFTFAVAAYNLVRLPKLFAETA